MRALILSLALASLFPLTASAADNTSVRRYGTSETLSVQNARLGEVLMVRSVDIKSDKRLNAGSAIGAAVGYASVRDVNKNYRNASRIAAGTIGGVAGTAIQNGVSKRKGVRPGERQGDCHRPGRRLAGPRWGQGVPDSEGHQDPRCAD